MKFYLTQISTYATKVVIIKKKDGSKGTSNPKVGTLPDKNQDRFSYHYQESQCLKSKLSLSIVTENFQNVDLPSP